MKTFFSALTLAVFTVIPRLAAQDLAPPQITSLSVSPNSADISSSSVTVQVTVNITDDVSGFSYGWIDLINPYGNYVTGFSIRAEDRIPGGTAQDGTYVVDVTLPRYGGTGTWNLRSYIVDQENRISQYGGTNTPFPIPANAEIQVTNSGQEDTAAPQLVSMSIAPDFVDVSTQDATVTVTINVTDSPSGLSYGYADLFLPDGTYSNIYGYVSSTAGTGTPQDGTYTFDLIIPRSSESGTWELGMYLTDLVGNYENYRGFSGSSLTVVNQVVLTGDLSDACDATQYAWTTGGNAEWFFQTETTFDGIDAARSGAIGDNQTSEMTTTLQGPGTLSFRWKVDSETGGDMLSVEIPNISGGTPSSQISGNVDWTEVTLAIPAGAQTVVWTYSKNSNIGFNEDAGWVDRVHFAADMDSEPPVLQDIRITPDPVNLAGGDREVTVTFELSDDFHGVAGGTVAFYDAFSTQYQSIPYDSADLISGNDQFGTYQVRFTAYQGDFIPNQNFEPGTWRADVEIEERVTSSYRYYSPGDDPFPNPGAELFFVTLQDNQGPLLLSLNSITPAEVDVTLADGSITVDFDVTDAQSGFSYGYIYLYTGTNQYAGATYFNASAGNGTNFSINVPVYRHASPGIWKIGMSLYDAQDNETYVYNNFPGPGLDQFTVVNTGAADSTAPTLQSITITPGTVNTGSSSANLNIDLDLADDLCGINYIFIDVFNPAGNKVDSLFRYIDGGRSLGGSFTTSLTLPQGADVGLWRVEVYLQDILGNSRRYGPGLNDTGFPIAGAETFVNGTTPVSTYSGFANGYLLSGIDAGLGANPDSDWAINALELVLGLNPTVPGLPDPSLYQFARTGNDLHLDFKVAPALTATPNGNFLDISTGGGGAPLRLTGQTAPSPAGPWNDVPPQSLGGGFYRVPMTVTGGGTGFLRLKFVDP